MKKNFVLDTNVLLHDSGSIYRFQENDIYLPIAVLEELDKFKKGAEQINYNARSVVRDLDTLATDGIKGGIPLGEGLGKLYRDRHCLSKEIVRLILRENP
jgi:PhoH-like ATPase